MNIVKPWPKTEEQMRPYVIGFTVVWLVLMVSYLIFGFPLFKRMFPSELGEFLSGSIAPLGFFLVGWQVALQREQNERSLAVLNLENSSRLFERVIEHMMSGIMRVVKSSERNRLWDPDGKAVQVSTMIGSNRDYAELLRGKEYERAVSNFGDGLDEMTTCLNNSWALDANSDLEEIRSELASLGQIVDKLERLLRESHPAFPILHALPADVLKQFRQRIGGADRIICALIRESEALDGEVVSH